MTTAAARIAENVIPLFMQAPWKWGGGGGGGGVWQAGNDSLEATYPDSPMDGLQDLSCHDEEGRGGQHGGHKDAHAEPLAQQYLLVPTCLVEQPAWSQILLTRLTSRCCGMMSSCTNTSGAHLL